MRVRIRHRVTCNEGVHLAAAMKAGGTFWSSPILSDK